MSNNLVKISTDYDGDPAADKWHVMVECAGDIMILCNGQIIGDDYLPKHIQN